VASTAELGRVLLSCGFLALSAGSVVPLLALLGPALVGVTPVVLAAPGELLLLVFPAGGRSVLGGEGILILAEPVEAEFCADADDSSSTKMSIKRDCLLQLMLRPIKSWFSALDAIGLDSENAVKYSVVITHAI
jgi:hypothetical protein